MQVLQVNNINFQGQIKKTSELKNLLNVSDKKVLERFNNVIDRMTKVNDGLVYKVVCHKTRNPLSYSESLRFYLNKENTISKSISCEHTIEKIVNICDSEQEQLERCSDVLNQFLPKLERTYPVIEDNDTKAELVQRIFDKLV